MTFVTRGMVSEKPNMWVSCSYLTAGHSVWPRFAHGARQFLGLSSMIFFTSSDHSPILMSRLGVLVGVLFT